MSELLQVRANYQLGTIEENLEEVEKSVRAYCDQYKGIVVREEDIPETKKLLAEIRKEKDALDTQRKDIKKAWNKPYDAFEKKVKGLLAIYDETINEVNDQLKAYEEQRKEYKRGKIMEIYTDIVPEALKPYVPLHRIYNQKWENATYMEDQVGEDINMALAAAEINISTIKALGSKWEEDALNVLKDGGPLPAAIQKIRMMDEQEAKIKASNEKKAEPEEELPFGKADIGRRTYTMVFSADFNEYRRLTDFLESTGIEYTIYEED